MYSKFPVRVDFTALSSMYPRGSNPRGSVLGRKDPEVQACHSCGSGHFIHFIGQGKQILELAIFVAARLAVSIDNWESGGCCMYELASAMLASPINQIFLQQYSYWIRVHEMTVNVKTALSQRIRRWTEESSRFDCNDASHQSFTIWF